MAIMKKQGYTDLVQSIGEFASQLRDIQQRAVLCYTPIVNDLIESKCQDTNKIEFTLDYVLDFASQGEGLALFRMLCDYLNTIDPEAASDYERYWNEQWNDQ